jgi:hypothetical protein
MMPIISEPISRDRVARTDMEERLGVILLHGDPVAAVVFTEMEGRI